MPTTYTVVNTADTGPGSLRQAILDANGNVGFDTIAFNIPGGGLHTIQPLSALHSLDDTAGVLIDGYSQPGASENTLTAGGDAVLLIQLDGSNAGNGSSGLSVTGDNNTIQGLIINRFSGDGIRLSSGSGNTIRGNFIGFDSTGSVPLVNVGNNIVDLAYATTIGGAAPTARNVINGGFFINGVGTVIQGNYLGTNAAGTAAFPNSGLDIYQSSNVLVGGTAPGAGNVIAGSVRWAILMRGRNNHDNAIQGNFIGTNPAGQNLGNTNGIYVNCGDVNGLATNIVIGGTVPGAGNVIGFCQGGHGTGGLDAGYGIRITGDDGQANNALLTNVVVQGNFIGTNSAGANLGNNSAGVVFVNYNQVNNTIGGTAPGAGNTIAFNRRGGVVLLVNSGTGNSIRGNSIHDNGGLGIDLSNYGDGGDGVTLNDTLGHVGPNMFQNFPVLTLAEPGSSTHVVGTLTSAPSTTFSLDIYANAKLNDTFYGEGERYLGAISVTTDAAGNASFDQYVSAVSSLGEFITATASDPNGNTSEFSSATPNGTPTSPYTVTNTNDSGLGSLREAIYYAYFHAGADTIDFNIPATGFHLISLASPLPPVLDSLTINGYTQAGSAANTLAVGDDAVLGVGLDGSDLLNGTGLTIRAGGCAVRGLEFQHFGNAIRIEGASATGNTISGNFIGTDGVQALGGGISIAGASNNTIGGANLADRNLIVGRVDLSADNNIVRGNYLGINAAGTGGWSGSAVYQWDGQSSQVVGNVIAGDSIYGIILDGGGSYTVQGNRIGADATGVSAYSNLIGIQIADGSGGVIDGNVIRHTVYAGMSVDNSNVQVTNNIVTENVGQGITVTGAGTLVGNNQTTNNGSTGIAVNASDVVISNNAVTGNQGTGIAVLGDNIVVSDNTITGNGFSTEPILGGSWGPEGYIDGNGPGVWIFGDSLGGSHHGASIRQNIISGNAGLGIDLGDIPTQEDAATPALTPDDWWYSISDGVATNDLGDSDDGSNGAQNYPVITGAGAGIRTFVQGAINSTANSPLTLDFYANTAADPSGHGEGERWLGSVVVSTGSDGNAVYQAAFDAATSLGEWITATATAADGSTSEFSAPLLLQDRAISGTAGSNTIAVAPVSGSVVQVTIDGNSNNYAVTGALFVLGGDGADSYTVNFGADLPATMVVFDDGASGVDALTMLGTTLADTFTKSAGTVEWQPAPAAPYRQVDFDGIDGLITLDAGGGNDTIVDPNSGNLLILGGDGNDTITVADTTGVVTVDGGIGSDTYVIDAANLQGPVNITDTGTTGTDSVTVAGTPEDDSISQSGNEVVANGGTITLGAGVDSLVVDGAGGADDFTVETPPTVPTIVSGVADAEIDGTSECDTIQVIAGANLGDINVKINGTLIGTYHPTGRMIVSGGGGNDDIDVQTAVTVLVWVYGGAGNDEIHGGGANDYLFGDDGCDKLFARGGDDQLDGGTGNDELHAGTGNDIAHGGDGCDELWGGTGNDQLFGDAGNDILRGGGGCDRLEGGDGDDELRAGAGGDTLLGGQGNDTIKGGQGSDWMEGGDGNDRLDGGAGNDICLGGTGDDLVIGNQGRDILIGGVGADRISGNADEDILIAGYTVYDSNAAALLAIQTEWISANSYATRTANIVAGTGLTAGFRLVGDDGPSQTVLNDNDVDTLAGGQGTDWFFANRIPDNGGVLDVVSDLTAAEMWTDTDF